MLITIILLTACTSKSIKYNNNDNAKLTGTISNSEEDKTYLTLDEPIIIGDEEVKKIELNYDKDLKDNSKVTVDGTIKDNTLEVNDIDNNQAYVNTFSNSIFKMTIPTDIIKIVTIEETDNGFIIYSTNNLDSGGIVVTIKSVTKNEFKKMSSSNKQVIEKVDSNQDLNIVIVYPTTIEYNEKYAKEYETICNYLTSIKKSIRFN